MKFVIKLKKQIERTVVLEADSAEDADKKLNKGECLKVYDRVKNAAVYGDFEYVDHVSIEEGETLLTGIEDVAAFLQVSVDDVKRTFFTCTECGMCVDWSDNSMTLVGYVEGADCEHPKEELLFPFTGSVLNETIERLEKEADVMWREWNEGEDS